MFWVFSEQTAVFQMLHHIQCMLIFLGNLFLYFKQLTFRQLWGGVVLVPKAGDAPLHSSCMAAGVIGKEHLKHGTLHPSGHTLTLSPQFNSEKPGNSVPLEESLLYSEIPK